MTYHITIAQIIVFGFCDFIAQSILVRTIIHLIYSSHFSKIHRCWIVWGRNIRVVIIPSILAFAFLGLSIYLDSLANLDLLLLVMWIAASGAEFIDQDSIDETKWGNILTLTGLTASMTVNALVTGLIVFRIFKVFREIKSVTISDETSLGVTQAGGRKLQSIIFIIIESG